MCPDAELSPADRRAVILLSGGLDSATLLATASDRSCHALTIDYGQRHRSELAAAERVAASCAVAEHRLLKFDLRPICRSALTDRSIPVPERPSAAIPVTYVPARNTIFLALALGWAETLGAAEVFIGVNALDYSGYPDCRPEFIDSFRQLATVATRTGVDGGTIAIRTPLLHLGKADIIRRGLSLGVDYGDTVSCYQATASGLACGRCDSCRLRLAAFAEVGIPDPAEYI